MEFEEMQEIIPTLIEGRNIYSKVAQVVIHQFFRNLSVLKALRKLKRKVGQLRFKSRDRFKSFTYNQSGFRLYYEQNILKLSKIGKIKIALHRKTEGLIKEVHIKRESSGRWFAVFVCEDDATIPSTNTMSNLWFCRC
jgi:putative transposase